MNAIKVLLLCWLQVTLRFASVLLCPTTLLTLFSCELRGENKAASRITLMQRLPKWNKWRRLNCVWTAGTTVETPWNESLVYSGLQGSHSRLQTGSCAADPPGLCHLQRSSEKSQHCEKLWDFVYLTWLRSEVFTYHLWSTGWYSPGSVILYVDCMVKYSHRTN